jgi:hypothetical protein
MAMVTHGAASDVITIVSGLPRSGTSMMMRMLEAGGLPALVDGIRQADDDNPLGYYEFERVKKVKEDQDWLNDARGKVVKMVLSLLVDLPHRYTYRVVFMRRRLEEILASQRHMLLRNAKPWSEGDDARMTGLYQAHLRQMEAWIARQRHLTALHVSYNELLTNPREQADRVNAFLGSTLDVARMVSVVDANLYRQKSLLEDR